MGFIKLKRAIHSRKVFIIASLNNITGIWCFKAVIFQNFMFICNGGYVLTVTPAVTSLDTSHRAVVLANPRCSKEQFIISCQSGKVPY